MRSDLPSPVLTVVAEAASAGPVFGTRRETWVFPWPLVVGSEGIPVVGRRRYASCDEEPKSFGNGAIQLAPIPMPITLPLSPDPCPPH